MNEFGVGRPAVREALFHLARMGLIEARSGERALVTRPTARVVFDSIAGAARVMLLEPDSMRHFSAECASFSRSAWPAKPPKAPQNTLCVH